MFWINGYATVWQPEVEEKRVKCNLSTSEKIKDSDPIEYKNSNWRSAVFIGKAYDKASSLTNQDRILIKSAKISNEKSKTDDKYYNNIVVFEFDIVTVGDGSSATPNPTRAPKSSSYSSLDEEESY